MLVSIQQVLRVMGNSMARWLRVGEERHCTEKTCPGLECLGAETPSSPLASPGGWGDESSDRLQVGGLYPNHLGSTGGRWHDPFVAWLKFEVEQEKQSDEGVIVRQGNPTLGFFKSGVESRESLVFRVTCSVVFDVSVEFAWT